MTTYVDPTIRGFYAEKHRHYHTIQHIYEMLDYLDEPTGTAFYTSMSKELYYAVCFHDAYYNPLEKENELLSCNILREYAKTITDDFDVDRACEIIMATKFPWKNETGDCKKIIEADTQKLRDFSSLIEYENGIFKEYQTYGIHDYITGRTDFLNQIMHSEYVDQDCIAFLLNYIKTKTYLN